MHPTLCARRTPPRPGVAVRCAGDTATTVSTSASVTSTPRSRPPCSVSTRSNDREEYAALVDAVDAVGERRRDQPEERGQAVPRRVRPGGARPRPAGPEPRHRPVADLVRIGDPGSLEELVQPGRAPLRGRRPRLAREPGRAGRGGRGGPGRAVASPRRTGAAPDRDRRGAQRLPTDGGRPADGDGAPSTPCASPARGASSALCCSSRRSDRRRCTRTSSRSATTSCSCA